VESGSCSLSHQSWNVCANTRFIYIQEPRHMKNHNIALDNWHFILTFLCSIPDICIDLSQISLELKTDEVNTHVKNWDLTWQRGQQN
jgi:hypothetical protein